MIFCAELYQHKFLFNFPCVELNVAICLDLFIIPAQRYDSQSLENTITSHIRTRGGL